VSSFDRLHPALQHHIVNSLGWSKLRPTQLEAIDPVLGGQDILLLTPTAGGKTEAAIFPTFSRMLSERWSGLSILYVCPIRALLNNLEPRLAHYAGLLGRSVALWHGDVGVGKKRSVLRDPPDLLLTTPESIESILISMRTNPSELFSDLRVIIVDELHAFAGDDRGWHLLALLERLNKLTSRRIQRIGLSATVGNPDALAGWFAGKEARVIGRLMSKPDGDVMIDYVGSIENAALVLSRVYRGEKRLVFCDSRGRVESLASQLRSLGLRTFVCHSSLSSAERRNAEEAFAQASDCVIVATSTLELGLDVGDLDRVIQIDAPQMVSSFLQRMGRTGRRPNTTRNCVFLATTHEALLIAAGLVRLWQDGVVENVVPPPRPLHILSQQILALVLQQHGLPENGWCAWVGKTFASIKTRDTDTLIAYMKSTGILVDDQGVLGIGPAGEAALGRRNFLELMSAFTTPLLITVRHGNHDLGEVAPTSLSSPRDGPKVILLGGRSWRVTDIDWKRRIAWVEASQDEGKSLWAGTAKSMRYALCRAVEATLVSGETKAELSNRATAQLESLRSEYAFCDGQSIPLVVGDGAQSRLWTFAGSAVNGPLKRALEDRGMATGKVDNFSVSIASSDMPAVTRAIGSLKPADCFPFLPVGLEDALKFSICLPPDEAKAVLSERLRDDQGLAETLCRPIRLVRAYETVARPD
jgi:ATP-dependent Lhr-like helicase